MQALKVVVIGLGVLIIISFVLLIYGFYTKIADPEFSVMKRDEAVIEETEILIPAGCSVAEIAPDGPRMFLRLAGEAAACARILVVDIESGRQVGALKIAP